MLADDSDGGVDVLDGERDAVHAQPVWLDGGGFDRVWVHVLEQFDAAVPVGGLKQGSMSRTAMPTLSSRLGTT
ncbi:hypothetical protein MB901379_00079 [Mycobacterium basiliense]|uniref:Uncharacterized protein n=1 Tax=Mycobacterium basiliense TaxID=2094119 RepID=A0A3S4BBZ5_9MYCO|nr:hypothetical protein [Mycobacterium basiliense]VDM86560.1 hypothetical protein MB901379_00079 [Mycobacterium basiliense]